MNALVAIELGPEVSDRAVQILCQVSKITAKRGKASSLTTGQQTWPLVVCRGIGATAQATAPLVADQLQHAGNGRLTLIVAERLLTQVRDHLEQAGLSYVDATGAVHLQAPGLLVHIERGPGVRKGTVPPPKGLGVVAVRIVQHLLDEPDRDWTVTGLAAAAGASAGQAHNLLARLDAEGLLQQRRHGRAVLSHLVNPSAALDWLAQVPAAGKLHERLKTYGYASNPDKLVTRLSHDAHQHHVGWAVTGAAAVSLWGPQQLVTALPVVMIRIHPDLRLPEAADRLGLEPVDSGHNILLVRDVGQLATQPPVPRNGPVAMAPKVRVYLDMFTESRGTDAADLFRETVLGY